MDHQRRERSAKALILCGLALLAQLPVSASSGGPNDRRFGISDAAPSESLAAQSGAGWERIRFFWPKIQPDGPEQWKGEAIPESAIDAGVASGREVVALLIGIPAWARDGDIPRGLYQPNDSPDNTWAVFVHQVIAHYGDKIQHWIIWNEPDVWNTKAAGSAWSGTLDDFAQLQRVAYTILKASSAGAVVHLAGMSYYWDAVYGRELYLHRLLRLFASDPKVQDNSWYFDVLTLHIYFRPDEVYNIVSIYRDVMREFGLEKPIWVMETNAPPSLDPTWPVSGPMFRISQEEQADYIPQAFSLALAAGAERIGLYKLIDEPSDRQANPEPFGLARMDGSPRPAFAAYQVTTAALAGVYGAHLVRRDQVGVVLMDQGDRFTTVIWSRVPQGQTVRLAAHFPTAVLLGLYGDQRPIAAQNGSFIIAVTGAICSNDPCLMGGPPVFLLEGPRTDWSRLPLSIGAPPGSTALPTLLSATPAARPTSWATAEAAQPVSGISVNATSSASRFSAAGLPLETPRLNLLPLGLIVLIGIALSVWWFNRRRAQ